MSRCLTVRQRSGDCATAGARRAAIEEKSQGEEQLRTGNRSGVGKTSAQPAPRDERQFVLEGRATSALGRNAKSRDWSHAAAQSNLAADREMDTTDAPGLFRCGTSPELRRQTTAPKVRADSRPLFQSTQLHKVGLLPPLHGASKM